MVDMLVDLIEAAPEDAGISSARLQQLVRVSREHVDQGRTAGVMTMVARHGKVVHFDAYGQADIEAGKPMASDTILRIYSMTKPIVSVALMMLYEEGRFQIDDPVSKYVPEFKDLKVFAGGTADEPQLRDPIREMTIRDILTHCSGLTNGARPGFPATPVNEMYSRAGVPGITWEGTLHDTIAKLGKLPLQVSPGTRFIYAMSTDVVAYLIEVLSGQTLDAFLRQRILGPLGMHDTHFFLPPEKMPRFAANYRLNDDGKSITLSDAPATSQFAKDGTYFSGVGGLLSTAPDYMRFAKMLAGGGEVDGVRIIGPRTLQFVTLNHFPDGKQRWEMDPTPNVQKGTGWGLGFQVVLDPAAAQVPSSPGEYSWSGAAGTQFFISPRDELAVVFMTQVMATPGALTFARDIRTTTYQALMD